MSIIVTIADAIVGTINTAAWSQSFTSTREYAPALDGVATSGDWVVQVVPRARPTAKRSKKDGPITSQYQIDIGVFKALTGDREAKIAIGDDGLELIEEFTNFWLMRDMLVDGVTVTFDQASTDPVFDLKAYRDKGIFCSAITLQTREVRG